MPHKLGSRRARLETPSQVTDTPRLGSGPGVQHTGGGALLAPGPPCSESPENPVGMIPGLRHRDRRTPAARPRPPACGPPLALPCPPPLWLCRATQVGVLVGMEKSGPPISLCGGTPYRASRHRSGALSGCEWRPHSSEPSLGKQGLQRPVLRGSGSTRGPLPAPGCDVAVGAQAPSPKTGGLQDCTPSSGTQGQVTTRVPLRVPVGPGRTRPRVPHRPTDSSGPGGSAEGERLESCRGAFTLPEP